MASSYFRFKQFTIYQERSAFKVGTDGVLLGACSDLSTGGSILDIGTGTGLIALMAAQRTSGSIVAIEPDHESFLQAGENIDNTAWKDRIELLELPFQDFCHNTSQRFGTILSNPPYFRDSLKNPDPAKSRSRHNDSLSSRDLLGGSAALLTETGCLQVILPYAEGNLFIAEAPESGLYCTGIIKIKPKSSGVVKRLILKLERKRKEVTEKFLTIETGVRHHYTEEYMEITKDFFLKL
jgi:tRNA1Val (adenine37-N6)-methyltransferase